MYMDMAQPDLPRIGGPAAQLVLGDLTLPQARGFEPPPPKRAIVANLKQSLNPLGGGSVPTCAWERPHVKSGYLTTNKMGLSEKKPKVLATF